MRFRFCNDLDCPDWVLSEITSASKMSSVKVRMLCALIAKSISGLEDLSVEKVQKLTSDIMSDANSVKGIVAVVEFIMSTAAKNECGSADLCQELEQLGMPMEHAQALSKVYGDYLPQITGRLKQTSLRLPTLKIVSSSVQQMPSGDQRSQPYAELMLDLDDGKLKRPVHICVLPDKLNCLISELETAASIMDQYQQQTYQ